MSLTRCHKQTTRTGITLYIKNYYKKQALHNDVGNLNDVIKMMMKNMQLHNICNFILTSLGMMQTAVAKHKRDYSFLAGY